MENKERSPRYEYFKEYRRKNSLQTNRNQAKYRARYKDKINKKAKDNYNGK